MPRSAPLIIHAVDLHIDFGRGAPGLRMPPADINASFSIIDDLATRSLLGARGACLLLVSLFDERRGFEAMPRISHVTIVIGRESR